MRSAQFPLVAFLDRVVEALSDRYPVSHRVRIPKSEVLFPIEAVLYDEEHRTAWVIDPRVRTGPSRSFRSAWDRMTPLQRRGVMRHGGWPRVSLWAPERVTSRVWLDGEECSEDLDFPLMVQKRALSQALLAGVKLPGVLQCIPPDARVASLVLWAGVLRVRNTETARPLFFRDHVILPVANERDPPRLGGAVQAVEYAFREAEARRGSRREAAPALGADAALEATVG